MSSIAVRFTEAPVGLRVVGVRQAPEAAPATPGRSPIDVLARQQEAVAERERRLADLADALRCALPGLDRELAARLDGMRDFVLDLAFGLAERVLGREIARGRYDLVDALRRELGAAVQGLGPGIVHVHLHPQDREALLQSFDGRPSEALGREVELEQDTEIAPGGFRIESELGLLRSDPATILATLAASVREELR